jgi:hypothetical protein
MCQCHVLEADGKDEILRVMIAHSRPIDVLLIDAAAAAQQFLARLACYRPNMKFLLIDSANWASECEAILSRLNTVLSCGGARESEEKSGGTES